MSSADTTVVSPGSVAPTQVVPVLRDAVTTLLEGYALAARALAEEGFSRDTQQHILGPLKAAADRAARMLGSAA